MKKTLIKLLVLYLFCSCNFKGDRKNSNIIKNVNTFVRSHNIVRDTYLVVVPNQGCPGCITVAEQFVKENYSNKKLTIVFTSVMSLKILKNQMGEEILNSQNVFIDSSDVLLNQIPDAYYPFWVHIKGNKIGEVFFQSPKISAMDELRSELKKIRNEI